MSEEQDRKSLLVGWVVFTILALPALYLLSVPPVFHFTNTLSGPRIGNHPPYGYPLWVIAYGEPYQWLAENTPLVKPLNAYTGLWSVDFLWSFRF